MNIEELINEIVWRDRTTIDTDNLINKLRTLLTAYTCEVAKIDEGIFYDIYMKMKINGVSEHVNEYNRFISEKYQAQPETPEPELQVGWEYQNKQGKWIEITSKNGHSSHPYNSINHGSFTTRGKWSVNESEHTYNLILSTGRPVQKQPSPNWWESLKEGDLVVNHHGDINVVRNWYQEAIGERRVFVEFFEGITTSEHLFRPYTPTPTEAIADLQAGKITVEQFQKVYNP